MTAESPSIFLYFWLGLFLVLGVVLLYIHPTTQKGPDRWVTFVTGLLCFFIGSFFLGAYTWKTKYERRQIETEETSSSFTSAYREYLEVMDEYIVAKKKYNELREAQIDDLTRIIDEKRSIQTLYLKEIDDIIHIKISRDDDDIK